MWQLQNFNIEDFLNHYWQKKPLLIRQAIPGFSSVISPQELAGLACEQGVHSRLVIEKDGETPWQLRYGPFSEADFTSLPATHYSLLVSECEKWIPQLQPLIDLFTFLPRWRIDDLMISYAPEHGSVGPHIDEYDVFLIQANGKRRWSIEDSIHESPALLPDLELAIMQEFNADHEWLLEPGDMLYLPPKIAHHGVAVGDGCMTYSVGFRAPSTGDIMDSFLVEAGENQLTERRYYDPPLAGNRDPAEITQQDVEQFKALVMTMLDDSAELWPDIIGKMVSDASLSEDIETVHCSNLDEVYGVGWIKHPDAKMFFYQAGENIHLYFNGQMSPLRSTEMHTKLCQTLCHDSHFRFDQISAQLDGTAAGNLVLALVNVGVLIPEPQLDE